MKRFLTLAVVFLCCIATSFAQFSGSGSGTENDPYLILNPIHLNQLRNFLNQSGVYFKLMADIDLTEYLQDENPSEGWQPVGSYPSLFKGVVDGNGKTISGLWIKRNSTSGVGFFGYTNGATIRNLTIEATTIVGKNDVGGMSGCSENTTFSGCSFTGEIHGENYVGGYVGRCSDHMSFSDNLAFVKVIGTGDCIGGFIGKNYAYESLSINNCILSEGIINGVNYVGGCCGIIEGSHTTENIISGTYIQAEISGTDCVGGLCGYNSSVKAYHTININSSGYIGSINGHSYVGGLVGWSKRTDYADCKIVDCTQNSFVLSMINANGDNVGGLVGHSGSLCDMKNCYFSGSVNGESQVGGLVGSKSYGTVSNCYASAKVAGKETVGGLIGEIFITTIKSSVALNTRVTATEGTIGRIVGRNRGTIAALGTSDENKSYNNTIVISQGIAQEVTDGLLNGTGVSLNTLKLKGNYVSMGFDFTSNWDILETESYPYMKTQTAPPVITSQVVAGATTISGKCQNNCVLTLEIDGEKQQKVSSGNNFSFTVSPLQAGHMVRVYAKSDDKVQSYFATELVSYLGKGTEDDPYQIYTASDLTGVYRKGYFKLMNDIDLTDYINQYSPTEGWISIGREGSETIHFDGNGHKITGLWCNSTRDNTGLFSCFANGTIKNLTVKTAKNKQVKGGANTGIIIGKMMNGTIENCIVEGTVADGTPVGGMVGLFDGGTISHCQANVTITTTLESSYVGGLVGETTGGNIEQCFTEGTLTGTGSESYVGGLIGKNKATLNNSYSIAVINSSYNAAGVVAYNYGIVDKCYAVGNLISNNYAAGIVGYNDGENAIVSNCVAMNNKIEVTFESQQQQSGGYGQRIIGGLKNNAPAPEMNNYALKTMQVSVNDIPQKVYEDIMNGTAKTAAELSAKETYQTIGWDFDNIWKIDEGIGYPYQTIKVESGTEPSNPDNPNPDDPNNPNDPEPQTTVEVTDISTLSNAAYIEPMEEKCGSQATISIKMKNTAAIRGFQFDLYLPEGVTVVKSSKGKIQGSLSAGRLPDEDEHTLTFSEQADGAIRFLCSSQYDETFTDNDGEIATLKVNIADDMEDGEYPIQLKNMKLTETNISNFYETALVQTKLTISSFVIGDINGDGVVDVSDYTGVANHIHGNTPDGFNAKAADVDISGTIDVSDYTGIANIIHTGSIYGNNNASARMLSPRKANTDLNTYDNVMYISPFTASAGTQTTLSIKMKNTAEIRGFQFDLYLPEGMTVVKSNKGRIQGALSAGRLPDEDEHELTFSEQADGAIRFLCSSQYDETFTGNDGEIATLQVDIANSVANGNYPILLKDMKLTETDISKFYTADLIETTVTIGEVDTRIILDETSTTAPEAANNVDVRVLRTIKADEWSTICLPFAMSTAQVKEAFGDDVKIANFTGYEATTDGDDNVTGIKVNFAEVDAIEANHPYVIKVSSAISEFTVDNVDIDPEDEPKVATVVRTKKKWSEMIGTYVANTTIENQMLFLNGNKFWYSNGSTKMKGYRAYFDFYDVLSEVENASAKITFFDGTTEITNVNLNDNVNEDAPRYNLAGQKVSKSYKGIVIQNGVKRIVK